MNLDNLYKRISEKGFTLKKVSEETGISASLLSEWKNGNRIPSVTTLVKVADFLDCSIDYLIGRKYRGVIMDKNKFMTRENAGRLACTLNSFSEDKNTVIALARILKYEPEQLKKDMRDIYTTVTSVPKFTAEE